MGRRTSAQLAQTRAEIISAAEHLFAEKGYANTQLAEIAARAGVGISAYYRQFPDKQTLLLHILQALFTEIRQKMIAVRSGIVDRTPFEQLMMIQQTYQITFDTFAAHPEVALVMLRSGYGAVPEVEKLVWESMTEIAKDTAADIRRAEANGLLKMKHPLNFGDALIGMIFQLAHRMLVEGKPSPKEAAHFCTRMTLGAILAFMPPDVFERVAPLVVGSTA